MHKIFQKQSKTSRGQSLIEAVVALGITVLILVTLVSGVVSALKTVQFARNKTLATKYAQEGIEAVRSIRDRGWTQVTSGTYGLSWTGVQWTLMGSSEALDKFSRTVTIADGALAETKNITVSVSWREGNRTQDVTLMAILTKLN